MLQVKTFAISTSYRTRGMKWLFVQLGPFPLVVALRRVPAHPTGREGGSPEQRTKRSGYGYLAQRIKRSRYMALIYMLEQRGLEFWLCVFITELKLPKPSPLCSLASCPLLGGCSMYPGEELLTWLTEFKRAASLEFREKNGNGQ